MYHARLYETLNVLEPDKLFDGFLVKIAFFGYQVLPTDMALRAIGVEDFRPLSKVRCRYDRNTRCGHRPSTDDRRSEMLVHGRQRKGEASD